MKKHTLGFWDIWNMSFGFWEYSLDLPCKVHLCQESSKHLEQQKMKFLCCGSLPL